MTSQECLLKRKQMEKFLPFLREQLSRTQNDHRKQQFQKIISIILQKGIYVPMNRLLECERILNTAIKKWTSTKLTKTNEPTKVERTSSHTMEPTEFVDMRHYDTPIESSSPDDDNDDDIIFVNESIITLSDENSDSSGNWSDKDVITLDSFSSQKESSSVEQFANTLENISETIAEAGTSTASQNSQLTNDHQIEQKSRPASTQDPIKTNPSSVPQLMPVVEQPYTCTIGRCLCVAKNKKRFESHLMSAHNLSCQGKYTCPHCHYDVHIRIPKFDIKLILNHLESHDIQSQYCQNTTDPVGPASGTSGNRQHETDCPAKKVLRGSAWKTLNEPKLPSSTRVTTRQICSTKTVPTSSSSTARRPQFKVKSTQSAVTGKCEIQENLKGEIKRSTLLTQEQDQEPLGHEFESTDCSSDVPELPLQMIKLSEHAKDLLKIPQNDKRTSSTDNSSVENTKERQTLFWDDDLWRAAYDLELKRSSRSVIISRPKNKQNTDCVEKSPQTSDSQPNAIVLDIHVAQSKSSSSSECLTKSVSNQQHASLRVQIPFERLPMDLIFKLSQMKEASPIRGKSTKEIVETTAPAVCQTMPSSLASDGYDADMPIVDPYPSSFTTYKSGTSRQSKGLAGNAAPNYTALVAETDGSEARQITVNDPVLNEAVDTNESEINRRESQTTIVQESAANHPVSNETPHDCIFINSPEIDNQPDQLPSTEILQHPVAKSSEFDFKVPSKTQISAFSPRKRTMLRTLSLDTRNKMSRPNIKIPASTDANLVNPTGGPADAPTGQQDLVSQPESLSTSSQSTQASPNGRQENTCRTKGASRDMVNQNIPDNLVDQNAKAEFKKPFKSQRAVNRPAKRSMLRTFSIDTANTMKNRSLTVFGFNEPIIVDNTGPKACSSLGMVPNEQSQSELVTLLTSKSNICSPRALPANTPRHVGPLADLSHTRGENTSASSSISEKPSVRRHHFSTSRSAADGQSKCGSDGVLTAQQQVHSAPSPNLPTSVLQSTPPIGQRANDSSIPVNTPRSNEPGAHIAQTRDENTSESLGESVQSASPNSLTASGSADNDQWFCGFPTESTDQEQTQLSPVSAKAGNTHRFERPTPTGIRMTGESGSVNLSELCELYDCAQEFRSEPLSRSTPTTVVKTIELTWEGTSPTRERESDRQNAPVSSESARETFRLPGKVQQPIHRLGKRTMGRTFSVDTARTMGRHSVPRYSGSVYNAGEKPTTVLQMNMPDASGQHHSVETNYRSGLVPLRTSTPSQVIEIFDLTEEPTSPTHETESSLEQARVQPNFTTAGSGSLHMGKLSEPHQQVGTNQHGRALPTTPNYREERALFRTLANDNTETHEQYMSENSSLIQNTSHPSMQQNIANNCLSQQSCPNFVGQTVLSPRRLEFSPPTPMSAYPDYHTHSSTPHSCASSRAIEYEDQCDVSRRTFGPSGLSGQQLESVHQYTSVHGSSQQFPQNPNSTFVLNIIDLTQESTLPTNEIGSVVRDENTLQDDRIWGQRPHMPRQSALTPERRTMSRTMSIDTSRTYHRHLSRNRSTGSSQRTSHPIIQEACPLRHDCPNLEKQSAFPPQIQQVPQAPHAATSLDVDRDGQISLRRNSTIPVSVSSQQYYDSSFGTQHAPFPQPKISQAANTTTFISDPKIQEACPLQHRCPNLVRLPQMSQVSQASNINHLRSNPYTTTSADRESQISLERILTIPVSQPSSHEYYRSSFETHHAPLPQPQTSQASNTLTCISDPNIQGTCALQHNCPNFVRESSQMPQVSQASNTDNLRSNRYSTTQQSANSENHNSFERYSTPLSQSSPQHAADCPNFGTQLNPVPHDTLRTTQNVTNRRSTVDQTCQTTFERDSTTPVSQGSIGSPSRSPARNASPQDQSERSSRTLSSRWSQSDFVFRTPQRMLRSNSQRLSVYLICFECGESKTTYATLCNHFNRVHEHCWAHFTIVRKFLCGYCNTICSLAELKEHHQDEHQRRAFVVRSPTRVSTCGECQEKLYSAEYLKRHTANFHQKLIDKAELSCSFMTRSFFEELLQIGQNKLSTGISKCPYCDYFFLTQDACDEHIRESHPRCDYDGGGVIDPGNRMIYGCPNCRVFLDDEDKALQHTRTCTRRRCGGERRLTRQSSSVNQNVTVTRGQLLIRCKNGLILTRLELEHYLGHCDVCSTFNINYQNQDMPEE